MKNSNSGGFWWILWVGLIAARMYMVYHKNHHVPRPYIPPMPQMQFNSELKYESPFEKYKSLKLLESGSQDSAPLPSILPQP
jgi:hypothetical protein